MSGRGTAWPRSIDALRAWLVAQSEHRLLFDTVVLGVFAALVAQVYNWALS